jgi:hypothetical protein
MCTSQEFSMPEELGKIFLKLRVENENLHEINNDNRVRVVKFPTSKNIVTDLINALPDNSFVNTNTRNNRRDLFSMRSAPG